MAVPQVWAEVQDRGGAQQGTYLQPARPQGDTPCCDGEGGDADTGVT